MMNGKVLVTIGAVLLIACGETTDPGSTDDSSSNDQVDEAITSYNDRVADFRDATCACYGDGSGSCDPGDNHSEFEPKPCTKTAAACDVDSFAAWLGCWEEAYDGYETCIAECPEDQQAQSDCRNEWETAREACETHRSEALDAAFDACSDDQTPECSGG